jgi:hypothetical protein
MNVDKDSPRGLVPKLRLGTPVEKLRFKSMKGREAELLDLRSQAELGNEGAILPCSQAELGNERVIYRRLSADNFSC